MTAAKFLFAPLWRLMYISCPMDSDTNQEKKLLDYALSLGLRPSEIANHLGIHRSHVHRWMNGSRPVPARYRIQLFGLIAETIPPYMTTFQAQVQGTSEKGLIVEQERARICTQLQELLVVREFDKVLKNATRALTMLKDMPQAALSVRLALPVIAFCANALLAYTNLVDSVSPLVDFCKEVEPDADLGREPSELGGDGQPSAINQQTDAALLAGREP